MPRYAVHPILATILLTALGLTCPAKAATVFSDESCEAPFILTVPAELVRTHRDLAVVVHDDGAGQRLVFSIGLREVAVTLQRGGKVTELARATAALGNRVSLVMLKRLPGGFAVAYDATTVLRGRAELPDGGRWGLGGVPAAALAKVLLQPTDQILFGDDFMRTAEEPSLWTDLSGKWRVAQLESARYSANAFTLLGSATGSRAAMSIAGDWFWEELTVEASVRPSPDASGFGIALACQPGGEAYLLRFLARSGPAGILELVRISSGKETVLGQAPAMADADDWHRLALSGGDGRLKGALNGVELLSAEVPTLAHGQIGLWVAGKAAVAFDDVEAYSGPRDADRPVTLSHEAQSTDPSAQAFLDDQYMQEWADERDQWLRGPDGIWHAGHYWGDVALSWEFVESALAGGTQLHICVPAGADTRTPRAEGEGGYHLELAVTADKQLELTLREGAQERVRKTIAMPELPATASLRRVGDTIEALVNGAVVDTCKALRPAAGKVGLTGPSARRQASGLSIVSRNLIDSTFRSAPVDWTIGSGEWGVTSRWACSPRWSWFQGRSTDLASIWTRRCFTGDVVVEFFAGISMDQPWAPFYQHPGNLAVTLSGSDGTPGSGYSLVFAGWGNSAAGIFRRGELVAQVPGFVMPDIVDSLGGTTSRNEAHKLHNEWRRIRAERIGSTVRLLVDGRLAASFDDPDPLPGGAVGIWTLGQAMSVARARVYYEAAQQILPPVAGPAQAQARKGLTLPRYGPPRRVYTFEQGTSGWRAASPGSCVVALADRLPSGADLCLEVQNPTAGGDFALAAPVAGVDVREHSVLAFDYALPADVHIDLFATVAGQRYRVALSGPQEPMPGCEDVGRIAEVRADGRWQSARLDLLGLLTPYFPGQAPIILEALDFAAHAVPEYMRAGIGGNPAHARWLLDNVYLGGVTSTSVMVPMPREVSVQAPGCNLTQEGGRSGAAHRVSPRNSGLTPLTIVSGTAHTSDLIAFDLDPPTLKSIEPVPGASWLGPLLAVAVEDAGPAGIYEPSLELSLAGRRFGVHDRGLHWRPESRELTLDLREAQLQLSPGQPVEVTVNASDRAGNHATPLVCTFTPDLKADTAPPAPPRLLGTPAPLLDCDFETDLHPIQPWGVTAGASLRRARHPAEGATRGGRWCLEACATRLGGLFGVSLGVAPFEASRYPVLEFDYRVPRELRVDLIVEVAGRRRVIKFTDNDQTWPVAGRIGAVADGAWHRATIDLHGMLASALGRNAPLAVTQLAFASSGWPGNREGTRWWLDNVRLSAAMNPQRLPAGLALHSQDESGIAAFAWATGAAPTAALPVEPSPQDLSDSLGKHAGGLTWLRAQAIDRAGNRSEAAAIPLRLAASQDAKPPVISSPIPADGGSACPEVISVTVTDQEAGVSPADMRLTINGRPWTIADEALAWDAASGQLTWSLPPGVSLGADGARVTCRLEATDLAANTAPPLEWTFRLEHARDDNPPAAPVVSYVPARLVDGNDFEQHTGGWGNFLASQVLRLAEGGASGSGCAEVRHLGYQDHGGGFVLMRDFGEGWREFPVVRFRYRAVNVPPATLQLIGTTFDGAGDRWTPLGSFPVNGKEWLTAEVDIAEALARTSPSLDVHRIFLSVALPPDGALLIDDYAMYSRASSQAVFRWADPASPSGITGYSWFLDQSDGTVPPERLRGSRRQAEFSALKTGRYVFHLRARDGAGNWGATSHVPFQLTAPAP